MITRNKQERPIQATDYQPDILEFDENLVSHEVSDVQLGELEVGSIDILALLREQRDEENVRLSVPERTFVEDVPGTDDIAVRMPKLRRGLSPWWLMAAVLAGFVLGFAMPHDSSRSMTNSSYSLISDSLHGCSIACGDVNTALLVSM